ncbi:MAG: cytochrome b/b6 domain-containing protein [Actinobacteria bacterium]|jgi:formate dehydrogenase subunit gamma|nr:cytochrome b/b6 domain-containing protein [Actinomycetota bacterium]
MSETAATLPRFSPGERWAHRSIGILTGILLVTAALLYVPMLGGLVGNRQVVRVIHEIAGFALPIPILFALFSRAFRDDAGRLNRFRPSDWEWLRSRDRRSGRIRVGKFNAGQKLNAAFTLGAIIVMFVTGAMMFFSSRFPDAIRTGATFVHDWLAIAVLIVVVGHIYMAYNDATARLGMRTGAVPSWWAEREHAAWADELSAGSSLVAAPEAGGPTTTDEPWVGDA